MLSLQFIRQNPELVLEALEKRHESAPLEEILSLDEQHRRLLQQVEALQAEHKRTSKKIGAHLASGDDFSSISSAEDEGIARHLEIEYLRQDSRSNVKKQINFLRAEADTLWERLQNLLLELPNIPSPDVPYGRSNDDNKLVRSWGEPRQFSFPPRPHWELGETLGIIDFQRGVKLSGTRFYVLKGMGALLQRALISFMLDLHTREHGYTEIYPPYMVKGECMVGSGNLPKFADNLYHDAEEDFWLIPTAEVPLTNLHREEIFEPGLLPLHYVAYTACFRREKMAAGRDTRGIKRGHQFDKVELYKVVEPDTSDEELERLVKDAEEVCQKLEIPYRVVQLCTAELGFASQKTFDIEIWAPGCREWLEVSSCSNCGDFQAKRANIRYRPKAGAKSQFAHTINGSGVALPRLIIALLENYQQSDGSIVIPDALRPYMGSKLIPQS